MKEKTELIRIVKIKDDSSKKIILLDSSGKLPGRGVYVCKSLDCLKKIKKNRRLERTFSSKIDESLYNDIEKAVLSYE